MILDQHEARLWADCGPQWNEWAAGLARRSIRPILSGVNNMIEHNLAHIRRFALALTAFVVSTAFVGVAVLPAALGLGPA